MSFKTEIKSIVSAARQTVTRDNVYVQVLDDFAEALCTDAISATVTLSREGVYSLYIGPRYQPANTSTVLTACLRQNLVTVRTPTPARFVLHGKESLEGCLKHLAQTDELLATLTEAERQAASDVNAYIRVRGPYDMSVNDLTVIVSPDQQKQIAELAVVDAGGGGVLRMSFDIASAEGSTVHPPSITFNPDITYRYLYSAGVVLDLTNVTLGADGKVNVTGRKLTVSP